MSTSNVEAVFAQADALDYAEGLLAYERYHTTLRTLASAYDLSFDRVVAAFATLSPNNDYNGTLRSLVSLLQAENGEMRISTYRHCGNRALSYLRGEADFLSCVGGKKIRSFYHNIINPLDERYVTVDGHMMNVWDGIARPLKGSLVGKRYDEIADGLRVVARGKCLIPNQLQAILWFTWKRTNRILYKPQLSLFHAGDQWQTLRMPNDIKPYSAIGNER